jgi:hypothetical protein
MIVTCFWLLALLLFALATRLGKRLGVIPIVSQLLLATFGLPLLMFFWVEPHWQLSGAALVAPAWLKHLYSFSFALLLGHILSDVVELRPSRQSLKIALPSFLVPLCAGLACAKWLLPAAPWLNSLALALVFAITAIPVLYLYLRHIDYPPAAMRRLLQAAILIDLACWSLFGLAQGSLHLASLALPLLAACTPLLLWSLRIRQPKAYSLVFFVLLMFAEHYKVNALILGIGYLLNMGWLKVPFQAPINQAWLQRLQGSLAIPLIITFGIVQIDIHSALQTLGWAQWLGLLALPIASKLAGNWLGLCWATPSFPGASRWRESVLLNIRGLSEIVFLNLLLQQQLISPALYFALMLMGLAATLLPALAGMHRTPLNNAEQARRPYARQ